MSIDRFLPPILALAWLLPLASFTLIVLFGPRMGRSGKYAAHVATAAIVAGFALSLAALGLWLIHNPPAAAAHGEHAAMAGVQPISGEWYVLAEFGKLRLAIGYYIDSLTIAMFCMVTLVASCIHVYSSGYMHGELSEVIDGLAPMSDGRPMRRKGRYHRFFQYLSLFCFSMLGLVIAGNAAMVFVFWELVGICSYLLIGFWRERQSASNAANKAFIVNRVGDFGMLIGLMVLWAGLGTFSFGNYQGTNVYGKMVTLPGIFDQVRPAQFKNELQVPYGMWGGPVIGDDGRLHPQHRWIAQEQGYWLLVVAGLGIFCGCIGKSAQFPLHVWLPDAMEGPTPVSALIHAATMVAAGVYLVGRFYPVFTPEVLMVIACVGCITLFMAATIALTATDIKRVLAYSTVSQLGFMMMALGLGGWLAGMFHLFTHAFFKSLLFLCSGSVIHACGTNEMPQMGGLRRKMPLTALTMLVGCLAIAGAGIPTLIGLSGFHSKDCIMAQALNFWNANPGFGGLFFVAALIGAGMTAFYMFRLWYMTFAGNPRDGHVYHHAHESPGVMTGPLAILAVFAIVVAWSIPFTHIGLNPLLQQSQPAGTAEGFARDCSLRKTIGIPAQHVVIPAEHHAHEEPSIRKTAEWLAFAVALTGFVLATMFYGLRKLDPADAARTFAPAYRFLVHKWWFDEAYAFLFVRPVLRVSGWVAAFDRRCIDRLIDGSAWSVGWVSRVDNWIDRMFVDNAVNGIAHWTHALGLRLRSLQTGSIRQYVLWIAVAVVVMFVLTNLMMSG